MTIETFIKEHKWYYSNPALTTANFPEQKVEAGEPQQLILDKWMRGPEVMALLKEKKLRPANVYELMAWFENNKDTIKGSGKWYAAFGSEWIDSDGYRRVPRVYAGSGGGFDFNLGDFEHDWDDGNVLLVYSDSLESQTLETGDSTKSLRALDLIREIEDRLAALKALG